VLTFDWTFDYFDVEQLHDLYQFIFDGFDLL